MIIIPRNESINNIRLMQKLRVREKPREPKFAEMLGTEIRKLKEKENV